jgi:hypothetical protein
VLGQYSNDEVARKYSSPTRRIEGSGFHPEIMGFWIARMVSTQLWKASRERVSRVIAV